MIGFLKKYKLFIIAAAIAITALAIAFMAGGNPEEVKTTQTAAKSAVSSIESTPDNKTVNAEEATKAENKEKSNQKETEAPTSSTEQSSRTAATEHAQKNEAKKSSSSNSQKSSSSKVQESTKRTVKDKFKTDPIPEGKPEPVEPEEQTIADKKITVTLSISCASVLNKMDKLDEDKHEMLDANASVNINGTTYNCWKIRSDPKKKNDIEFSYRICWYDKKTILPVKMEYYDKKDPNTLMKTYLIEKIDNVNGITGTSYVLRRTASVTNHITGRKTRVTVKNFIFDDERIVNKKIFTTNWLMTGK